MLILRLLGEIEVVRGGERLTLPPSKRTRALLAYLAVTGRRHRRDRLCSMLWEVPDDPRGALRWSLSKLRALVDEPDRKRITADRDTVGFDPEGAEIDVSSLRQRLHAGPDAMTTEQLEEAAREFRGEFLEDLDLASCPEFQAWRLAEREELKALHGRVLKRLAAQLAAHPERALPHVRTLVNLDQFDEAARALLVRLLSATGRRDEAEQQYELGKRSLAELGAPPSGELEQAKRDLRGLTRAPRSADAPSDSAAAPAPSIAPSDDRGPQSGGSIDESPSGEASTAAVPAPAPERKEISVLVAVVGRPPDLEADGGDPEVVMSALDPALAAMKDAVRRYDGIVSTTRPDGLTALFGAPVAHEDHAVRACHAAIGMQAAVRDGTEGRPNLRIGVHSGEVVVRVAGDGAGPRLEAIGPVASLAAQIGALAESGTIVVTSETARRAEGFVEVQPLSAPFAGAGDLPPDLLVLRGTTGARTRWEVRATRGLTPFIGRDAEMGALAEAIGRVAAGKGEVVAVVADPGIGKSRLVHEFVRTFVPGQWTVLKTSAASHDAKATYRPVSRLLRSWFGVEEQDLKPQIERKVRTKIEDLYPELEPILPALASLLDLSVTDPDWLALGPPQRRRRTLDAIKAVIARESQRKPLVLLFEDLHWIDGETQAVLDTLVDSLGALRVFLLVTYRPEYRHGWTGKSYFSHLRLLPLPAAAADRLLESLIGRDGSLQELRRDLVARTEGTPLFAEETVRALAEAGALAGRPGDYRLGRPLATFEIPSTIHAVIAARIDRLPPAGKHLLQVASIIGRDVPLTLLRQVAGLPGDELDEALAGLRAAEFLYEVRLFPDVEYSFKHALTHEVAYGSVLRERRRAIHIEIVRTIETLTRDRIDEQLERLAHHAVKGHLWEKAIQYLHRAASKAIQRSAHRQAIAYLGQGLELISKLPDPRDRLRTELDYQKAIGVTMMAAKGWGAQEVSDAYVRARALAEELGDERELFVVLRGQGQFHMIRGEVQIARELGDRCVDLARGSDDPALHIETHHLFWSNSFFMGDYAAASRHSERGMALYDRERDHRLTYVYSGHDPGVCCRCFAGLSLWQRGDAEQALVRCRQALELATDVSHPLTIGLAHWGLSYVHMFRREPAEAQRAAEREIAISEEYLLPLLLSQGQFQLGWALAAQGSLGEGIALMQKGLEAITATGAEMGLPYFAALLGEALARSGRFDDGLAQIERALRIVERSQARFQLPEIQRLKGELLMMRSDRDLDGAIACFRDAMVTARAQDAPLAELRAATSLARRASGARDRGEASRHLAQLCRRFEGMPDSIDLREARTLMAERMP